MKLELIVGNKNFSSWSLRAYLALKATKAPYQERLIPLREGNATDELKKHSPSGKVPTLIADGHVIWDSLAIGEFLAETFKDSELLPEETFKRAHARCVISEMHSGFLALRRSLPMDLKSTHKPYENSESLQADIKRILEIWNSCLNTYKGPYLFGGYGLADAFFAPVVTRFVTYDIKVPELEKKYMDSILNHEDMKEWTKEALKEGFTFGL